MALHDKTYDLVHGSLLLMGYHLKTTQNLNQQNNAEILCKNDYALSF